MSNHTPNLDHTPAYHNAVNLTVNMPPFPASSPSPSSNPNPTQSTHTYTFTPAQIETLMALEAARITAEIDAIGNQSHARVRVIECEGAFRIDGLRAQQENEREHAKETSKVSIAALKARSAADIAATKAESEARIAREDREGAVFCPCVRHVSGGADSRVSPHDHHKKEQEGSTRSVLHEAVETGVWEYAKSEASESDRSYQNEDASEVEIYEGVESLQAATNYSQPVIPEYEPAVDRTKAAAAAERRVSQAGAKGGKRQKW